MTYYDSSHRDQGGGTKEGVEPRFFDDAVWDAFVSGAYLHLSCSFENNIGPPSITLNSKVQTFEFEISYIPEHIFQLKMGGLNPSS